MSRNLLLLLADVASFTVFCLAVPASLVGCVFDYAATWLEDLADTLGNWEP